MRQFMGLLGRHGGMAGASWATWRTVLIGANGERLEEAEAASFRRFAGRNAPQAPASLAAFFIGRRGGKDVAAAVQLVYLALCCPWKLARGEIGVALLLAVDRAQVRVAFNYIKGVLESVPLLAAEVDNITADRIVLKNGIEIQVGTSDYAAVRGRTVVVAILDEYAFWIQEQATEVVRALRPTMATQPDARLIVITSVYASTGPAFEMFARWGQDNPRELVVRGTTRDFNPTVAQCFIDAEIEADPQAASAEYLSIPRSDVESFIDRALLDSRTRVEPREVPHLTLHSGGGAIRYFGAVDISGGRGDAAAAAVVLRRADRPDDVIVAAVRRWPAPHDPKEVAGEAAAFFRSYGLCSAYTDAYGAELSMSIYRDSGIGLIASEVSTSEAFLGLLPLLSTGRLELPDDPHLRRELLALERRTGRSGRDAVGHPPRGHDDVAAACAHACWAAARSTNQVFDLRALSVMPLEVLDGLFDPGPHGPFIN